jgi:glycosyltransferase involved in cell wall biosynthesis
MMAAPWLSVLMPCFNGERFIRQTFESVLAQNESDYECVVVDGGSTDGSLDIVSEYARVMPIRLFHRADLPDWMAKTNFALEVATGQYVSMLHTDDVWLPGRYRAVRQLATRHPEAVLILHASQFIDARGRPVGHWQCPLPRDLAPIPGEKLLEHLLVQNFVGIPTPTIKHSVALELGGIDRSLWYTGDWDFYLKLCGRGPALYIPTPLAAFRIHASSLTVTGSRDLRGFLGQMDRVVARHADRLPAGSRRREVEAAALLSNQVNCLIAGALHGSLARQTWALREFVTRLARCPLGGLHRYLRDARLHERILARVRGGLLARREVS